MSDKQLNRQKDGHQQVRFSLADEQQDHHLKCKKCGTAVSAEADICEHCRAWLLDNRCCFCYTEVSPGQKFCRNCGNPPAGIVCPDCHQLSHFDFCPACRKPLSRDSGAYLDRLENSDEFKMLKELSEKADGGLSDEKPVRGNQIGEWLKKLQEYGNDIPGAGEQPGDSAPQPALPQFVFGSEAKDVSAQLEKNKEQLKQRAPETIPAAEKEALRRKIAEIQAKTFTDNQSARKFYTAIQILLPRLVVSRKAHVNGWRCNWTDTVHPCPEDCGNPGLGGEWLYWYEEIVSTEFDEL